jgi:hypothetical protein
MDKNRKLAKLRAAVESVDPGAAARLIVETILEAGQFQGPEYPDPEEIAADFIENEVGRFDWMVNWNKIKSKGNPVHKVMDYLETYGIDADPEEIVDIIDQMVIDNPGRWK